MSEKYAHHAPKMVARCCRSCGLKTPHTTPTPRPLNPKPATGAAAAVGGGVRGVSGSHHLGPVQGLHQCSSNRGSLSLWDHLDFCMRRPFVDFCMRRPNLDFWQGERCRGARSLRQSSPGGSPRSPHRTLSLARPSAKFTEWLAFNI